MRLNETVNVSYPSAFKSFVSTNFTTRASVNVELLTLFNINIQIIFYSLKLFVNVKNIFYPHPHLSVIIIKNHTVS